MTFTERVPLYLKNLCWTFVFTTAALCTWVLTYLFGCFWSGFIKASFPFMEAVLGDVPDWFRLVSLPIGLFLFAIVITERYGNLSEKVKALPSSDLD